MNTFSEHSNTADFDAASADRYTYLIVDDEELIRKGVIKKLLPMQERIYCIGEAENGLDAIHQIELLKPDIVILDMQMPVMDGTQFLPYLTEHYPGLPLIVISGYKDFDYMKYAIAAGAVDYILKPFSREAIQECVSNAITRLESRQTLHRQLTDREEERESAYYEYDIQILKNLILGYHTDTTSLSSRKLNYINHTHKITLFTLYFRSLPCDLSVQTWLSENGFGDLALYLPTKNIAQTGFLILFSPENRPIGHSRQIIQIATELISWFEQNRADALIGISRTHSDLSDLSKAFIETSYALDQRKLQENNSTFYFYDPSVKVNEISWDAQEEFLFRIEAGMETEVKELCDRLFDWFLSTPGITLADVKLFCYQLSNRCFMIISHYLNQQDVPQSSSSMQNVVRKIFQLEELRTYYTNFFLNTTRLLKNQSVYAIDDTIEKIQIYIQRNYAKPITQDFIAFLFYLNRSYLSTLFKAQTGEKFIDYLNNVRISKAKELLVGTDRKMYQIARMVGYDNVKYFFRIFKKKTGVTPEQYRASFFE